MKDVQNMPMISAAIYCRHTSGSAIIEVALDLNSACIKSSSRSEPREGDLNLQNREGLGAWPVARCTLRARLSSEKAGLGHMFVLCCGLWWTMVNTTHQRYKLTRTRDTGPCQGTIFQRTRCVCSTFVTYPTNSRICHCIWARKVPDVYPCRCPIPQRF